MLALERVEVLTDALLCIAIDPWSLFIRETVSACWKSVLGLFYYVYYSSIMFEVL